MRFLAMPILAVRDGAVGLLQFIGGAGYLALDALSASRQALLQKRGRRLGWLNLWAQMCRVGVQSVPIVCLVLFCIGSILAFQMAPILRDFGMTTSVADVISVAMFRELGPLVSAIVLTGFAGASIAAEMGTMVVSEEIEALNAMAIDPVRLLVAPRVIATTIMMVCLAIVGDVVGVLGGMAVARWALGLGAMQYLTHTIQILNVRDVVTGLVKAGVFGMLISTLACHLGLRVTGGAQGVGLATTRTVVYTIVALIAVDLLFTMGFYSLGL